ncbi:MAG: hypothetical protein JSW02_04635 [candidate division WOR-3 bacterium]|nr:MAG: hypothetical protein JSW02_04635 [candidate division WOR-3 bacterium]
MLDWPTHGLWVEDVALLLYYDYGKVCVEETATRSTVPSGLHVSPSIVSCQCCLSCVMPQSEYVTITCCDAVGRIVDVIFTGVLSAGQHEFTINTTSLANGVYFLMLDAPRVKQAAKFIVTR